ncbi:PIG-X [Xylariales sp. AK1849]|nr:PIG-X [Xylariales sp. AK1849]
MRQRTTFFHHNEDAVDPASIKVNGRSITGPEFKAVREDRFTLGLEELPLEIQELLRATHELHIRWSSASVYEPLGPWTSRLPPGLHAFYTAQKDEQTGSSDPVCAFLRSVAPFENCSSSLEYFSRLPNDRFSHSTAYQSYLPLRHLAGFPEYAAQYVCSKSEEECKQRTNDLFGAKSFDVSYDTISHVVKVTVLWDHKVQALDITSHPDHRVEVGLLTPDTPAHLEDHEIGVTGLLTVLGEHSKPSPTLFSFPSRHHSSRSTFSSEFLSPIGLHPTMQLLVGSSKPPMENSFCSMHAYFTLPRTIFADKYQLEDPLFLASKNLTALRYISQPVDLEAPDYVMKVWGSSLLLELNPPATEETQAFTAEVPLHLRYQMPRDGGEQSFIVPYPAVFWACTAEEGTKFPTNPFDRVNLGYDGLFGPRTLFWHLDPVPQDGSKDLMLTNTVPVLDLEKSLHISAITSAVVVIGFAWVVYKLLAVYQKTGYGAGPSKGAEEKKTQ